METNSQPARTAGKLSVLRNRNFTLLWIGMIVSNSGSWMTLVGNGWLVYNLTHSSFDLGMVGMARAIPMVIFPPMGGVIADRLPRLKLLKVTQTISCFLSFGLALLVVFHVIQVWQVVVFAFLNGFVNAFDQPTRQAMLPDLVRREDLTKAVALNSSAWQGSALFGPALAGVTIAAVGLAGAFLVDAFSYLAVVAALFAMQGVPEYGAHRDTRRGLTSDFRAGIAYVRAAPLVLTLLLLSTLAGVFGRSFQQFLPVFAREVFHQGSLGLGLMTSAPGAGTLVGAALITILADSRRKGLFFLGSMLAFGLTLVAFSFNTNFLAGIVLLFFVGMFSLLFTSMLTSILQLESAPQMRGRVMSLMTVTMQGFSPFGSLLIGAASGPLGTETALGIAAAICAVIAVVALVALPRVRAYESAEEVSGGWGGEKPASEPAATIATEARPPALVTVPASD